MIANSTGIFFTATWVGEPSNWPKWKVDHNMPKLPGSGLTYILDDTWIYSAT